MTTNFLNSTQRRILKLLPEDKYITSLKQDDDFFVSYGSFETMKNEKKLDKTLFVLNYCVSKILSKITIPEGKTNAISKAMTICQDLGKIVSKQATPGGLWDQSNDCDLLTKTKEQIATSINNAFLIYNGTKIDYEKVVACGIYANLYKKVVAMAKNINPNSRGGKTRSRKALKTNKANEGVDQETTHAEDYKESVKVATTWIEGHLDYSLFLCCIDKVCYLITPGDEKNSLASAVNTLLGQFAIDADPLIPIIGGSVLSFLSQIRFYKKDKNNLNASRKLRLSLVRSDNGNWHFNTILEPGTLNIYNEAYRSKKSVTNETMYPYEVFIVYDSKIANAKDYSGVRNTEIITTL